MEWLDVPSNILLILSLLSVGKSDLVVQIINMNEWDIDGDEVEGALEEAGESAGGRRSRRGGGGPLKERGVVEDAAGALDHGGLDVLDWVLLARHVTGHYELPRLHFTTLD